MHRRTLIIAEAGVNHNGDRARALAIPTALREAVKRWQSGERDAATIRAQVDAAVRPSVDSVDYVDIREADTLAPPSETSQRLVIALAVRIGGTRLIDNVVLGEDAGP